MTKRNLTRFQFDDASSNTVQPACIHLTQIFYILCCCVVVHLTNGWGGKVMWPLKLWPDESVICRASKLVAVVVHGSSLTVTS